MGAIKDNRRLIDSNRLLINHNKEEILDAMNQFATDVENHFEGVDTRLSHLEFNQAEMLLKLDDGI